jgi:hypothetical protein
VSAVICWLELNVIIIPSAGEAGIVIVPVARVAAGTMNSVCVPAAKV